MPQRVRSSAARAVRGARLQRACGVRCVTARMAGISSKRNGKVAAQKAVWWVCCSTGGRTRSSGAAMPHAVGCVLLQRQAGPASVRESARRGVRRRAPKQRGTTTTSTIATNGQHQQHRINKARYKGLTRGVQKHLRNAYQRHRMPVKVTAEERVHQEGVRSVVK